jgi:hypothetical protein
LQRTHNSLSAQPQILLAGLAHAFGGFTYFLNSFMARNGACGSHDYIPSERFTFCLSLLSNLCSRPYSRLRLARFLLKK